MDWTAAGGTKRNPQRLLFARCPVHNALVIRRADSTAFVTVCAGCEDDAIKGERKIRSGWNGA